MIALSLPGAGLFVEIDSATSYGDVEMAVEIDTVRTQKKSARRVVSWQEGYCKLIRRGLMGFSE